MSTVTNNEYNEAMEYFTEKIKDCKMYNSFLDSNHPKADANDYETEFKSENIQIDFCWFYSHFKVTTDPHTFIRLKNDYEALWKQELINRYDRRNKLTMTKGLVSDEEFTAAWGHILKREMYLDSPFILTAIIYGPEYIGNKDTKDLSEFFTTYLSKNIEICTDYSNLPPNKYIIVFTNPETFSKLKRYHDESIEEFLENHRSKINKSSPTVEPKPVESESKPESAPNGFEYLNTEASAIVKAYNTVNEVLDTLKIGSGYKSDYSARSYLYLSRAELMGIGLSALLTPDGDYSRTNMLKYMENTHTRYYNAIGVFPEDNAGDTHEYKREYYTATLRYLFVCIVQNGLDLTSDLVREFNHIKNATETNTDILK